MEEILSVLSVFFNIIKSIDILSNTWETGLNKWIPHNPFDEMLTLLQVMAWCRQATSHYLSQCCPRYMASLGHNELPHWFLVDMAVNLGASPWNTFCWLNLRVFPVKPLRCQGICNTMWIKHQCLYYLWTTQMNHISEMYQGTNHDQSLPKRKPWINIDVARSSLVLIMAWSLCSPKPFSEPMMDYCQLDIYDINFSDIFNQNTTIFIQEN